MKKYLVAVLGIFCSVAISISGCGSVMNEPVPVSIDENGEAYYNPTKVAIYAIQYCGQDSMVEKEVDTNEKKALECIEWLIDNAVVEENGNYVWKNVIYDEYSDMENDVEFIFPYEALQDFNPLELMGLVLLLCILILTFLGIAMFMLSLFGGKLWAVLGGFFIVFLLFFVENTPGYNRITIARFVPVYWLELALSSTPSSGYYRMPSVTYMLIFLILSILAISLIICRKINRIELNWENEDV